MKDCQISYYLNILCAHYLLMIKKKLLIDNNYPLMVHPHSASSQVVIVTWA